MANNEKTTAITTNNNKQMQEHAIPFTMFDK